MRVERGQTLTISGQLGWPPDHKHSPWLGFPHTAPASPGSQDCTWKGIMMIREPPGMHFMGGGGCTDTQDEDRQKMDFIVKTFLKRKEGDNVTNRYG